MFSSRGDWGIRCCPLLGKPATGADYNFRLDRATAAAIGGKGAITGELRQGDGRFRERPGLGIPLWVRTRGQSGMRPFGTFGGTGDARRRWSAGRKTRSRSPTSGRTHGVLLARDYSFPSWPNGGGAGQAFGAVATRHVEIGPARPRRTACDFVGLAGVRRFVTRSESAAGPLPLIRPWLIEEPSTPAGSSSARSIPSRCCAAETGEFPSS